LVGYLWLSEYEGNTNKDGISCHSKKERKIIEGFESEKRLERR
jgi:hypothetical protein